MKKKFFAFFIICIGTITLVQNGDLWPYKITNMHKVENSIQSIISINGSFSSKSKKFYYLSGHPSGGWGLKYINENSYFAKKLIIEPSVNTTIDFFLASNKVFCIGKSSSNNIWYINDEAGDNTLTPTYVNGIDTTNKRYILSKSNSNVEFYAYRNANPNQIDVYGISLLSNSKIKTAIKESQINFPNYELLDIKYNQKKSVLDLLLEDKTNGVIKIGEVNPNNKDIQILSSDYELPEYPIDSKLFAYGDDYYVYNLLSNGFWHGVDNNQPKKIGNNLGRITTMNIFDNKIFIGTNSKSLWYLSSSIDDIPKQITSFWKFMNDTGDQLSNNDYIIWIPENINQSKVFSCAVMPYDSKSEWPYIINSQEIGAFDEIAIFIWIILGVLVIIIILILYFVLRHKHFKKRK